VIVELAWAPDLLSGTVLRSNAAFSALGIQRPATRGQSGLTPLHQRVVRGTACPMLTVRTRRRALDADAFRSIGGVRNDRRGRSDVLRGTRGDWSGEGDEPEM
jgi:hypothetical protein